MLLGPVQSGFEAVSLVKERNTRDREWSVHYSVIATGASCVSWVTVSTKKASLSPTPDDVSFSKPNRGLL